jgi:citrate lyase subunit beta/citryl-CoA lyase
VLHPDQISIANEMFTPDVDAFVRATQVLDAYEAATTTGDRRGAVMFGDEMIDEASRKLAARVVERGRRAGLTVPG